MPMESFIMVRTICCEAYRECGRRCAICPNRPENRDAVLKYREKALAGLGRNASQWADCTTPCSLGAPETS
jgi:hypothetical protein